MAEISTCTDKFVIDRIESGFAVLENAQTLENVTIAAAELPKGATSGHTLVNAGGAWQIDHADTAARRKRISEKFNRLKSKCFTLCVLYGIMAFVL